MSFRRLSKNALAATLQVVASALLLFELYRFLAQALGPAQIGVWSLVVASVSITQLAELGLGAGVLKFAAEDLGAGRRDQAAATVGISASVVGCVMGLVAMVAFPLISRILANLVAEPILQGYALALLPWAVASLWLNSVGGVFASALDACQRSAARAAVVVSALLLQLVAAYMVVPHAGIVAMGPIQVLHSAVTLIALLHLTRSSLGSPWGNWRHLDRRRLIDLAKYGATLQLAMVGQMLFDPVVKALMTSFGGLAATGYYEMANRAVVQLRAVLVSAFGLLVPYLATKAGSSGLSPEQVRTAYLSAYRLLFVVLTPYFAALGSVLPVLLTAWVGHFDGTFVTIGFICLLGWYGNTLAVPAYTLYLAVGGLRWIMWNQLAIGFLNVALGIIGGGLFGGLGVAGGAMTALVIGSLVVVIAFHWEYDVPLHELLPSSSLALSLTCIAGLGWAAIGAYRWVNIEEALYILGTGALVTVVVSGVLLWHHPSIRAVVSRTRSQSTASADT